MRNTLSALLVATMTLGACGVVRDSNINPFNWFGRAQSEPVVESDAKPVNPLIPQSTGFFSRRADTGVVYAGTPFDQVTGLRIERVPGGAIVRATGLAARQGIYDVQLTPATEDETPVDGVLTYRLEGLRPEDPTRVGAQATREVTAARKLTDQDLRGVRTIRVEGLRNAQVVRR
ncbi:hypothetical protein [Sulfitobacter sp. S190]|uniref:hypothetical protein n=1 Tax=Sulfitobacter sp. S190 TaxID=2867022 RepID=UPI0021A8B403|nr:hypothetical protein [Sulfitobacter sp. S190]UWR23864.1 hypothetical protein K3756_07900 [Sulfitobacter sp. S190]